MYEAPEGACLQSAPGRPKATETPSGGSSVHEVTRVGATLGVMGGGQLGRMFVHAAQAMGYNTAVEQFPSNVIAGAFAFKQAELLEAIHHLDQPLADPAYVPTFQLAAFTRRHVTVALRVALSETPRALNGPVIAKLRRCGSVVMPNPAPISQLTNLFLGAKLAVVFNWWIAHSSSSLPVSSCGFPAALSLPC